MPTKRKIPKEVKKLGNRFLPWNADITLRPPDGPPKGLRLSEPCGACCLLDFILEKPSVVNDGVSMAGHMYADIFIQTLLNPVCHPEVEKVYQWATTGWSGMDAVVDTHAGDGLYGFKGESSYVGHYEFKTSSEQNPKPKLANRQQVIRQRVVMARYYGILDKDLFNSYIFIISKGGRQTNRVHGPFLIEPTAEELLEAQRDIDLRIQVYDDILEDQLEDPYEHPLLKTLRRGSCTRCFPLERAEPTPELESVFTNGRQDWEDWIQQQKLAAWIKDVKEKAKPFVPMGQQVETDYFLIRHTESGRLYIDPKNLT